MKFRHIWAEALLVTEHPPCQQFAGVPADWISHDEEPSLGAEILDSSIEFLESDGNAGCYTGLEFIGDVGRDPFGSFNVND